MDSMYDYKRFAILFVDDEEVALRLFCRLFGDTFRIFTAPDVVTAYQILEQHQDEIGLLLTDQRMPGPASAQGTALLERARAKAPRIMRILSTAYADMEAAIQAVNTGAIYKYVAKPWEPPQLEMTLKRALEFFIVQRERDMLLREKISVLQKLMITDRVISLGVVAAGLGHYVQNSLVAVRTFLDLAPGKLEQACIVPDDLRDPTFWRDFYGHVRAQVQRITEMLQTLGQVTERPQLHFDATVKVHEAFQAALDRRGTRFSDKGLILQNLLSADLPALKVDGHLFNKLWDFLLEDELVNLPPGSTLKFSAQTAPLPNGSPGVRIEVQDNGPGLPENALRSVFDPFFLRGGDPKEFGINLMACYFIVYHHGGRIEVGSSPEKGVSYKMHFPLEPDAVQPEASEQEFLSKLLTNERLWDKLLTTP